MTPNPLLNKGDHRPEHDPVKLPVSVLGQKLNHREAMLMSTIAIIVGFVLGEEVPGCG